MTEPTFQFTRHAHSCTNLLESQTPYLPRNFENDPGLSLYGILTASKKACTCIHRYQSNTVFVSCLVRTWMTAAILYALHPGPLTLIVSPFIMEKFNSRIPGGDGGNLPGPNQRAAFQKFLDVMYGFINENTDRNAMVNASSLPLYLSKVVDKLQQKTITVVNDNKTLYTFRPPAPPLLYEIPFPFPETYFSEILAAAKKIVIEEPVGELGEVGEPEDVIPFPKAQEVPVGGEPEDVIPFREIVSDDYLSHDIDQFRQWAKSKYVGQVFFFCVSHSKCMQSFCKHFFFPSQHKGFPAIGERTDQKNEGIKGIIGEQNLWDFRVKGAQIRIFSGVTKPGGSSNKPFQIPCENQCNWSGLVNFFAPSCQPNLTKGGFRRRRRRGKGRTQKKRLGRRRKTPH